MAVGVGNRQHHIEEQPHACIDRQCLRLTVVIDLLAVHVFEDQVLPARLRGAGVNEPRDVGMDEAPEKSPFMMKAVDQLRMHDRASQKFDSAMSFETAVAA